jgi:glutaminyl-peptide cyclotransferase
MLLKNKRLSFLSLSLTSAVLTLMSGCGPDKEPQEEKSVPAPVAKNIPVPDFNPDSAYSFIHDQVALGPRVPGSKAHAKCAEMLAEKLRSYGFVVEIPKGQTVKTYDHKQFVLKNIIASFHPEAQNRILICSHWDTRPIAESDEKDKMTPGDGANDGASGVGVAMEIARLVSQMPPAVGVDIIYFDLEDYGENGGDENTWCLGSQYWSQHLHKPGYYANFGILLDMVGGPKATFVKEGASAEKAPAVVEKVWKAAEELGYGAIFLPQTRYFIGADDHIWVNAAGIPCIDIIEYNGMNNGFPLYHHTHQDNMDMIDKGTLKAVGQTLLEVIYKEK